MPTDLLTQLKRVQMAQGHPAYHVDLGNGTGTVVMFDEANSKNPFSTADSFMFDFFQQVEKLRELLYDMQDRVCEVKRLHSDILVAPDTCSDEKGCLEEHMAKVKSSITKARALLKDMEKKIASEVAHLRAEGRAQEENYTAEIRIMKMQHSTLTRMFIDVMTEYNECQVKFRQLCKERIQRELEIADRPVTNDQLEDMIESGNPAIFTREIMAETQEAQRSLRDIEARHQDILKLEKSIRELTDIFIDMAMLVDQQGELVDRIETNILATVDHVEAAKVETNKAVAYQKSARKKLIITIVIVLLVVLVVVIILSVIFGRR